MVFVFGSIYVMDYIYGFAYVDPVVHPQEEAYLIVMDKLFDVLLLSVCQYLLKIFACMLIKDFGRKFFFVLSLCRVLVSE